MVIVNHVRLQQSIGIRCDSKPLNYFSYFHIVLSELGKKEGQGQGQAQVQAQGQAQVQAQVQGQVQAQVQGSSASECLRIVSVPSDWYESVDCPTVSLSD